MGDFKGGEGKDRLVTTEGYKKLTESQNRRGHCNFSQTRLRKQGKRVGWRKFGDECPAIKKGGKGTKQRKKYQRS